MAENQNRRTPWAEEIRRASASCADALRSLDEFECRDLPETTRELIYSHSRRLHEIRAALDDAFRRYSSEPSYCALAGREMTGEPYHLAQAMIAAATEAGDLGDPIQPREES